VAAREFFGPRGGVPAPIARYAPYGATPVSEHAAAPAPAAYAAREPIGMAVARISIDGALCDPKLLGAALGPPETWATWRVILRAALGSGITLNEAERATFKAVAGDRAPPTQRVSELWCVLGRRSGKTRMAAAMAVYLANFETHNLAAGELGYILLIAASKSQASVAYNYVVGFMEASPILRNQIENVTADEIRLKNRVVISVHAGSYRTIRGRTLIGVIGDESSFWKDETSAQPDVEIFRACQPALAATGGMWIAISTGYRRTGLLFQRWRDFFGQDSSDVLVVQGSSTTFNPSLSQSVVDRAKAADPEASGSEWEGEFRSDIAAFLDDKTIDAAIDFSRPMELPPRDNVSYSAFCDPSGGRGDAMVLCAGHEAGDIWIADVIRGRAPPFDPKSVVEEFAALLKDYGLNQVTGDNYSAAWVQSAFENVGIKYHVSELNKSQLYLESLPLWMRNAVSIPDHPRLIRELRLLERRATRAGKDMVDHGKSGSDDYANAVVGALVTKVKSPLIFSSRFMNKIRRIDQKRRLATA
jgi:hypothetical protein